MGASMVFFRSSGSADRAHRGPGRALAGIAAYVLALLFAVTALAQTPPTPQSDEDRRAAITKVIGLAGIKADDPRTRVAELFQKVRAGEIQGGEFFARLADIPAGMKEVREVRTAIQQAGLAETFLGPKYPGGGTHVEKVVLEYRRKLTERIIAETLRSVPAGSTVFVAKVGKWAAQAVDALTFDGDIDFSFIAADMRVSKLLKSTFDSLLRDALGLAAEARGVDVVATTHGQADSEVYTGDAGQGFAEQALEEAERKAREKGEKLVLIERADAQGKLTPTDMAGMRARLSLERALITDRASRLPDLRFPTDPGLSMEMVRHLLHDIKGSTEYTAAVLIVKASKYLQRSDQSAKESGFASNGTLSTGADEIVTLSKDKDASKLAEHLLKKFGKDGKIDPATAEGYITEVERGIWRNVEVSIQSKVNGIEKGAAQAERATGEEREKQLDALKEETLKLHDTLEATQAMHAASDIEMPATVKAQVARVNKLVEKMKALGRPITEESLRQKHFVEEMLASGKPSAIEMAMGTIYRSTNLMVDETNAKLDFMDDYLFAKLRGDRDFEQFLKEMKETQTLLKSTDPKSSEAGRLRLIGLKQRAQKGLADVNRRLNETLQSSSAGRGLMRGVMVIGLSEELPTYWNAFSKGEWRDLAMEFFRHRLPVFSGIERAYVEGRPSDYAMVVWDTITTFVPQLGLVQAAGGIAWQLGNTGFDLYWDEQLQVFVDEAYAGARFKPVTKAKEGEAWFATWRLVGITYRDTYYDLSKFVKLRREQITEMAAELRKPQKKRNLDAATWGSDIGLIDRLGVDKTLAKNLAAADPQLRFLEELSSHPQIGPLLEAEYGDQKRVRWEQVKLAFLVETIDRLEKRWARDWAAKAGQLDALQKELARVTGELEITRQVDAALAAAKPGKLSLFAAWLHALERDLFLQPDAIDEATEEVGRVQEAIVTYRAVLETRAKLEKRLGTFEVREGGLRLMTGPTQLRGLPANDKAAPPDWTSTVDRLSNKADEELRSIKVRLIGGSLDDTRLEPGFDRDMARKLSALDVWRYSWARIMAAGDTVERPGTLDDPAAATERLKAARIALLDEFAAHYLGAGVLEATVVDRDTGAGLDGAEVRFGSQTTTTDGQGRAIVGGIQPGTWELSASAADHTDGTVGGIVYPVPPKEGAGNRRVVKLALAPTKVEPRQSGLVVRVHDQLSGKPISGARVTVSASAVGSPKAGATGGDGSLRLDGLVPGNWTAMAEAQGHESGRSGVIVLPVGKSGPSEVTVSFALKPIVPPKTNDEATRTDEPPLDGKPQDVATKDAPPKDRPPTSDTGKDITRPPVDVPDTKPKDDKGKTTKFDWDKVFILPEVQLNGWQAAHDTRASYMRFAARPGLPPDKREKVKEVLATVEAREKLFWDTAAAETAAAEAYLVRLREQTAKIYADFKARGPQSAPSSAGEIVGLDGERLTVAGQPTANRPVSAIECELAIMGSSAPRLNGLDNELITVRKARELFKKPFAPEWETFGWAMMASEKITVAGNRDAWKTSGYDQTIPDPCGGAAARVTQGPASVTKVPTATPVDPGFAVKLALEPTTTDTGRVVVVARTSEGKPPFRYEFTGAEKVEAMRATYRMPAIKGTDTKARVKVTDAEGRIATAELPLEPLKLTVTLTRTDPAGQQVRVGDTANFSASLTSEGRPVDAKAFTLRWQASNEARFSAAEGPGVVADKATFTRPGKTLIWVIALQQQGGALATAAESKQIEIDVVAPGLSLTVDPQAPYVGDRVEVTARENPPSKPGDVSYRWSLTGEAENAGPTADQRRYDFVAKSDKPVTVTLDTLGKAKGDTLASAKATVTPRLRQVTVKSLGPTFGGETTKIVIWKQGQGLVRLDKEIAAFEDVGFKASIEPAPSEPVRWAWSVGEGTSLTGNPASEETRAQRASTGSIEVTAVARDARGFELGRGTASVAVTVSDEMVRQGRTKAKELDEAKARAEQAWATGDVDGACRALQAARAIQPNTAFAQDFCAARDRIAGLVRETEAAIAPPSKPEGIATAGDKLKAIAAINPKAAVLADLARKVEAARAAITVLEAERRKHLDLLLAGAQACKAQKWKECRETIAKGLEGGDKVFRPQDAPVVEKAKALAVQAAAAEKKAADAETDRKQRLGLLLAGAEACRAQKWKECRETITKGLTGGDKVFHPEDGPVIDKAKALMAAAVAAEKKAADDAVKTEADRKQRLDLLATGAQACKASRWTECRAAITKALEGGEKAFRPEDAGMIDKAKALAARAEAEEKKAAEAAAATRSEAEKAATRSEAEKTATKDGAGDTAAERQRHVELLKAGKQAYIDAEWSKAADLLARGLQGGERLFLPYDAPMVDEAEALLGAAREAARQAGREVPATAPPSPPVQKQEPAPPSRDGVYRGFTEGYFARPRTDLVFTVTGDRIVLGRGSQGSSTFTGQVAPNGDFLIEFSNNRWTGHVENGELTGKWQMFKGILNDRPTNGTFHASRS